MIGLFRAWTCCIPAIARPQSLNLETGRLAAEPNQPGLEGEAALATSDDPDGTRDKLPQTDHAKGVVPAVIMFRDFHQCVSNSPAGHSECEQVSAEQSITRIEAARLV